MILLIPTQTFHLDGGALAAGGQSGQAAAQASGAWTGVGNWPRESLDREWRGEFARVRFYDEALTAQQVALLQ